MYVRSYIIVTVVHVVILFVQGLDEKTYFRILVDIAEGMRYISSMGLVHRQSAPWKGMGEEGLVGGKGGGGES